MILFKDLYLKTYLTKAHVISLEHSMTVPMYIEFSSPTSANTFLAMIFPTRHVKDPMKNSRPVSQHYECVIIINIYIYILSRS